MKIIHSHLGETAFKKTIMLLLRSAEMIRFEAYASVLV